MSSITDIESTVNTLSAASDDLKKAAKDDLEVRRAKRAEEKKKAEKKTAEEKLEKITEAAALETGEGTSIEGATINVAVDGVTPSTGITGTTGVSVDEKA